MQVDVPAYARALGALAADRGLRARMGAAGRAHVREHLDWRAVVPRYLDLAGDLAERRRGAAPTTPALSPAAPSPLEIDPFELYAGYPSAVIDGATPLRPGPQGSPESVERADRVSGRDLYRRRPMTAALARRVLDEVAARPGISLGDLARRLALDPAAVASAVLALAKADALRLPEPPLRDAGTPPGATRG